MRAPLLIILLSTISVTLPVFVGEISIADATPAAYTLYGRASRGWGFTPDTISSPGPLLTAQSGELVAMSLFGADNPPHDFLLDYDGDGIADSGEPHSPTFSGSQGITYSFFATTTPGMYRYLCTVHPSSMFGDFRVETPPNRDLAVIGLVTARSFAYDGVSSNPITVDVTVANQGSLQESFTTTFLADGVAQGTQQVTLAPGVSAVVSFEWNAHLLPRGNYDLAASVPVLSGETDSADNTFPGPVFTVRLKGDVNNDCKVDIVDPATAAASFDTVAGNAGFNPEADVNNDGAINIVDMANIAINFDAVCT